METAHGQLQPQNVLQEAGRFPDEGKCGEFPEALRAAAVTSPCLCVLARGASAVDALGPPPQGSPPAFGHQDCWELTWDGRAGPSGLGSAPMSRGWIPAE